MVCHDREGEKKRVLGQDTEIGIFLKRHILHVLQIESYEFLLLKQ